MGYEITDYDREYFAKQGEYPLRTQILLRKYETGESEAEAFRAVMIREVYEREIPGVAKRPSRSKRSK